MKTKRLAVAAILAAFVLLAGCASYYDSSVPGGTGLGAASGALLGYGLSGSGVGAAAGAGAGALAGALGGLIVDEMHRQPEPAPPPQAYSEPYPQYAPAPQAYATQPDPTRGELRNNTGWRMEVYIDGAGNSLYLAPRQSTPVNLDIGNHRITAKAYVDTQFGERLVGTHTQTVYVDPRSTGWSLRLDQTMF
jgi:hypothetical protein